MSNWGERVLDALALRSAVDAEEARKRLEAEKAKQETAIQEARLSKERLEILKSEVGSVPVRSFLEQARSVWQVGKIFGPDLEVGEVLHKVKFSLEYDKNTAYLRKGIASASQGGGFVEHYGEMVPLVDKHYLWFSNSASDNTSKVFIIIGDSHSVDGGYWEENGGWIRNVHGFLCDDSDNGMLIIAEKRLVSIEEVVLEFCEQRILNKQLPFDYKY